MTGEVQNSTKSCRITCAHTPSHLAMSTSNGVRKWAKGMAQDFLDDTNTGKKILSLFDHGKQSQIPKKCVVVVSKIYNHPVCLYGNGKLEDYPSETTTIITPTCATCPDLFFALL